MVAMEQRCAILLALNATTYLHNYNQVAIQYHIAQLNVLCKIRTTQYHTQIGSNKLALQYRIKEYNKTKLHSRIDKNEKKANSRTLQAY